MAEEKGKQRQQRSGGGGEQAQQQEKSYQQQQDELQVGVDNVDESADTTQYPADIGYTVTSHGDGTPSISQQLVDRREEVAEWNADPDRENKETAKKLGL